MEDEMPPAKSEFLMAAAGSDAPAVSPEASIGELVEKLLYREPARILPVVAGSNHLAGCRSRKSRGLLIGWRRSRSRVT